MDFNFFSLRLCGELLLYFEDAEVQPLPNMLVDVNWEDVKSFFEKEIKRITNF